MIARKPSSFGSYAHSSPLGSALRVSASWGLIGGESGRGTTPGYPERSGGAGGALAAARGALAWVRDRHRGQEFFRVGVARVLADLVGVAGLDDLALVHHRDAVGNVANDADVVRDEDVGQAEFVLKVVEQVDDLRLDRYVERRDRLVAEDQLRFEGQSPGDPDPLPLPAGEFMRVAVVVLGGEADPVE